MKTVHILAIGNSFSEDATHFLHQTAAASGIQTKVVNLYIGGCSLERHWTNIENNNAEYQYQLNGKPSDRYVSIQTILHEEKWDYIVTQQASHDSGWRETYEPFLGLILDYLKKEVPGAEILLQETWAYEFDSTHPNFMRYHRNQKEMYERLCGCYREMADKYGLRLIPCGDAIQALREEKPFRVHDGGRSLCRDGFHMSLLYGRYLLACVWLTTLFQVSLEENTFVPYDSEVENQADPEVLNTIRQVASRFHRVNG